MIPASSVAPAVEFVGAAIMVLPDLPYAKSYISSATVREARRELFDKTSLMSGSEEFDALFEQVRHNWDGELDQKPSFFLLEKPVPGHAHSLFAVYDEDSEGPFGDLMGEDGGEDIPEGFDGIQEYVWENNKWDVICSKQVLDDWVSEQENQGDRKVKLVRALGFVLFMVGFAVGFL